MQAAWHKPGWDCRATLSQTRESTSQRNRTKNNSFTRAISIESGIQNKLEQGLQYGSRSIGSGVQLVPFNNIMVCVCVCVLAPGDLRRWPVACRELEVLLPPFGSRARNYQEKSERFAIHAVRFPLFSPLISEINLKKKSSALSAIYLK